MLSLNCELMGYFDGTDNARAYEELGRHKTKIWELNEANMNHD